MSDLTKCPNCASKLEVNVSKKISTLDLIGVAITGAIIFGFLSLLLFTSNSLRFVVFIGGLVAFGLYHLVGYSTKTHLKCKQCGYMTESEKTKA